MPLTRKLACMLLQHFMQDVTFDFWYHSGRILSVSLGGFGVDRKSTFFRIRGLSVDFILNN